MFQEDLCVFVNFLQNQLNFFEIKFAGDQRFLQQVVNKHKKNYS